MTTPTAPPPLFPVWTMPATALQKAAAQPPPSYGSGPSFNFTTGDFVLDSAGDVEQDDGLTAWAIWCAKAVLTQRNAYLIYDAQYGTDLDTIEGAPSQTYAAAVAQVVITEALLADRRTASVSGFTTSWLGETLTIAMTVQPVIGSRVRLAINLNPTPGLDIALRLPSSGSAAVPPTRPPPPYIPTLRYLILNDTPLGLGVLGPGGMPEDEFYLGVSLLGEGVL